MTSDAIENPTELIRELQARLDEAEETLHALRSGDVDSIVALGPGGGQVYTLKGADETYRMMVEEMAEGALTLTMGGLILFSNQQFATMLRVPPEQVTGTQILEFVVPEDIGIVSALLAGTHGKAEVRLTSNGMGFLPVYLSVRNVVLDGSVCQCLIVTDLSTQKRYEEIVAVMEAVPVGVFIARDTECRRMVGNRMAYELLRVPAGAGVSEFTAELETPKMWREVRDGRDIPAEELPMRVAASSGQPVYDYEFDMVFDDGSSRSWVGNAVPLFDETRQPRGAVGTFVDVTDRRRAAEALKATNAELRDFTYALAHGLREPLDTVLKSTQLEGALKMDSFLKRLLHYCEITERSGENLSSVDCNRLLLKAQLSLQSEIQASGAIVTSDPLPAVVADEAMLLQVFENLIRNSVRYRSRKAPAIHISAVRTGERWLFSVRDNGIGIEREGMERVFDLFGRLDGKSLPGPNRPDPNIGLALCKKVIERHGGRMWVESEAGSGATFRFTLPIYLNSELPGFSIPGLVSQSVAVSARQGV